MIQHIKLKVFCIKHKKINLKYKKKRKFNGENVENKVIWTELLMVVVSYI